MPKTAKKEGAKEGAHSGRAKKAAARSGHPKSGARLSVKQVKSGIGHAATFRRTLEALGLRLARQTPCNLLPQRRLRNRLGHYDASPACSRNAS